MENFVPETQAPKPEKELKEDQLAEHKSELEKSANLLNEWVNNGGGHILSKKQLDKELGGSAYDQEKFSPSESVPFGDKAKIILETGENKEELKIAKSQGVPQSILEEINKNRERE